jgi:hypothetical protein
MTTSKGKAEATTTPLKVKITEDSGRASLSDSFDDLSDGITR